MRSFYHHRINILNDTIYIIYTEDKIEEISEEIEKSKKIVVQSIEKVMENMEKLDKLIVLESEILHDVLKEGTPIDPEYTFGW